MPEILSRAGVLACDGATMLLYIPSVFSHTLKCGTTAAKAPGEIHNRTLQTGHWWHPLNSDFHTLLTPNFPSSALHHHRTLRFSSLLILLHRRDEGSKKESSKKWAVKIRLVYTAHISRGLPVLWNHVSGPHGPHVTSSGHRLDSDSMTWALTNICWVPDWGRRRSLCVYVLEEVQGERRHSGRQRVFMRACFDQGKFNEACACFWDSAA